MHSFLGFTVTEWAALLGLVSLVFGGFMALIRYFKNSISVPLTAAINGLNLRLDEMNQSRKENEAKLFEVSADNSKEIARLEGRVNTLEINNQSNIMRLDRIEK